jgi:hypothetical protein
VARLQLAGPPDILTQMRRASPPPEERSHGELILEYDEAVRTLVALVYKLEIATADEFPELMERCNRAHDRCEKLQDAIEQGANHTRPLSGDKCFG